jgi:Beta/Gamma crystallin
MSMTRAFILAVVAAAGLAAGGAQAQPQARGAQPPPGNYFQTCRNVSTYGFGRDATMTAECRDRGGRWRSTSIRFAGCDRIDNRDGALFCLPAGGYPPPGPGPGGPGPGPGPGPGMGVPTLTLFSAPNFGGRPFTTQRDITNLPRQDNDRAMSLRIEGRRPWMVCTDSDFRGRCQVFDHDVADLRQFSLAGKISSMRPTR